MILLAAIPGCTTTTQNKEAVYGPTQSVIEVVSVLRRHVPDDTYRFPPASDFTGRNVYRSTLLRLENLERVHSDSLRAGQLDGAIHFAKGRSLERLRSYDLAAEHYRLAASRSETLKEEALRSAHACEELHSTTNIGIQLANPVGAPAKAPPFPTDDEKVLRDLDERMMRLSSLSKDHQDTHYAFVIREEAERTDVVRARYFVDMRHALPDGPVRAVSELQRVVTRHGASKNRLRHRLELADFYATLAEDYAESNPPESLRFDPVVFQELVDAASQIYQSVASEDGTPEKLEAARHFEAFLAFTLQVDRDRFAR